EITIAQRLAEVYAHATRTLAAPRKLGRRLRFGRLLGALALAATVVAMFLPVHLSALAPAEVVAVDPWVVSAPLNGVIKDVLVDPNTQVEASAIVFHYDDTTLRNQLALAERSLIVSIAEHRRVSQSAFRDARAKAQLAALEAQVDLATAERDFAAENLSRVEVPAGRAGLVLMSDKRDLIGQPVEIGQRIMQIADTGEIELRVDLPIEDAIVSQPGAEVRVFLDVDPLNPVQARVIRTSYHAVVRPDGLLAYQLRAAFDGTGHIGNRSLRPGLRGTAKVYGEPVKLGFYLLRRPFAMIRQLFGL
ncbi:MAG: efflux RND transporter periplasmic adaptor subunit, partial [Gammaproteobacteria bacterium]